MTILDRCNHFQTLFVQNGGPRTMDLMMSYFSPMERKLPAEFNFTYLGVERTIQFVVTGLQRTGAHQHEIVGQLQSLRFDRLAHDVDLGCNYNAQRRYGPLSLSPDIFEKMRAGEVLIS